MEIEGISFPEALRILAPKAGVTLKNFDRSLDSKRNRLLDISDLAAKFYHHQLLNNKQAEGVRQYLTERGLSEETIEEWKIGYSLDSWDSLFSWLKSKNYNENEIFMAGLAVKREGSSGFYDRFRGRIMFPLCDINSNTVGFSARVNPEKEETEKLGKYINTPQTIIYDKSKILFALDRAKQAIRHEDLAVLVEGQMDAVTAHQNGFTNVVASSGTALTVDQVNLLKRYSQKIALAFDMDDAGIMAAERGIDIALGAEMEIKVIEIKGFKDPDECIRQKPDMWRTAVTSAKPVMQYYFDKTIAGLDLSQATDRRQIAKKLLPVIAKLGNKIEKSYWLKKLGQIIDIDERILYEALEKAQPKKNTADKIIRKTQAEIKTPSREQVLSESLLAVVLKFPVFIDDILSHVQPEYLIGDISRSIYNNLIIYYNYLIEKANIESQFSDINFGYNSFRLWLEKETVSDIEPSQPQILDRLVLLGDKDYFDLEQEQAQQEIRKISNFLKKNYLSSQLRDISRKIGLLEQELRKNSGESAAYEEINAKLKELMEDLRRINMEMRDLGN
jgi:DNA primase